MRIYEIDSMPRIQFAHVYGSENYTNRFGVKERLIEVTLVTRGTLTVDLGDEKYVVQEGDLICGLFDKPSLVHSDGPHEHHTVCATVDWRMLETTVGGLYLPLVTRASQSLRHAESIIELFIRDPLTYQDSPTRGAAKFLELLCEIDRCNRKGRELIIPGEALYTQRAKQYIQEHLHEPICQSEVAKHLSITPEYLCAVFKKTEGVSLIRYANVTKLSAIRSLVEKENMRLYEAAARFGYSDPNYVSRLFKKYFGYRITENCGGGEEKA